MIQLASIEGDFVEKGYALDLGEHYKTIYKHEGENECMYKLY